MQPLYLLLLPFLFLAACGSGDRALTAKKNAASTSSNSVLAPANSSYIDPAGQFSQCVNLQVYEGIDADTKIMLSGMSACPSISSATMVKIKPSTRLPSNERICIIPSTAYQSGNPSCTAMSGDTNINLQLSGFTSITIVREAQLNNYWNWDGYSDYYPTMAHAQLR